MHRNQRSFPANSVNDRRDPSPVVTLGRRHHARQVRLDRYPATVSTRHKPYKIATWNVRTLYQKGKIDNVVQEMKRMKIDVLGISEARWTGTGKCDTENGMYYYTGGDQHMNGVGIFVTKKISNAVMGVWPVSDRIMMLKIQGSPFNIMYCKFMHQLQNLHSTHCTF